jgi:Bacteriocin-protection, YdeI or OmpD-Associated
MRTPRTLTRASSARSYCEPRGFSSALPHSALIRARLGSHAGLGVITVAASAERGGDCVEMKQAAERRGVRIVAQRNEIDAGLVKRGTPSGSLRCGPMSRQRVPGGVVHKLPEDLREALVANTTALDAWRDITPLARNEFICWVEDAKQETTRERRIRRTQEELEEGQRRPCCWPGCTHREPTGARRSTQ